MKKFSLVAALLLSLPLIAVAQSAGTSEESAVRQVVQSYLGNDPDLKRRALSPEAKIFSVHGRSGKVAETAVSKPSRIIAGATTVEPSQRIVSVDVTRGGAVVKVESEFPPNTSGRSIPNHIQYLSLLKLDGEWKIVSILMPPLGFAESASK